MKSKLTVLRRCISCRVIQDRRNLLKITKDYKVGILMEKGMGRSAYICKTEKCLQDSKIIKKLQKALKLNINRSFYEIFEKEIANYK